MKRSKKHRQLSYEDVMNRYGQSRHHHKHQAKAPQYSISKTFDDGEVLVQRNPSPDFIEYVVQSSVTDIDFEEYVVQSSLSDDGAYDEYTVPGLSSSSPMALSFSEEIVEEMPNPAADYMPTPAYDVAHEYQVDVLDPLQPATPSPTWQDAILQPNEEPVPTPASSRRTTQEVARPQATDDDFTADMEAILKGEKMYDPNTKQLVDKNQSPKPPVVNTNGDGMFNPKNSEHAIFDKIAQSMQYANAYDLGTVDLGQRFSDFDTITDIENRAATTQSKTTKATTFSQDKRTTAADFIEDLDAIRKANLPKDNAAANEPVADVKADEEIEKINSTP